MMTRYSHTYSEDMLVSELLIDLGDRETLLKAPDLGIPGVSAERGEEIVTQGFTQKVKGGKTKKQSKHFICTSCHNVKQEDPSLKINDPQSRLEYTTRKGLPFLQGTTLYGAVNRSSYYNGDYEKKYGDLVKPARNNVREAIQLCAIECAQGRALKEWEIESILAYLWDIGYTLDDVNFSQENYETLESAPEKIDYIKSLYLSASEAHFVYPPDDRKIGYGLEGNAENGKLIYENSCLHCHYQKKYSFLHLDNSKLSFKHLRKHAASYKRHSIYQVIRWGVSSKSGKRSYMPQYTQERMSDQQVEDLRAYIEFAAE